MATKKTTTITTNQDNRIQVTGDAGTLIGPGGALNVTNTGMAGADLKTLLDDVLGQQSAATRQLANIVAATKAPDQTALSSMLPWLGLGLLFLFLLRRHK